MVNSLKSMRAWLLKAVHLVQKTVRVIIDYIVLIVSSRYFFWGVIAFFIFEAVWVACSFRYPMVFDESFHVTITKLFSNQLSPFILNQPDFYDRYGNLSNGNATIFHYLMSFPYRLIVSLSGSFMIQIVFMRVLNIIMVASGLMIFANIFKKIGIRQVCINVALLFFALIPIVSLVAATVNYDNMLFLFTAWYLAVCVNILKSKKIIWHNYVWLVIIGCFASLVKFTFLPIFAASAIYLIFFVVKEYGKTFIAKFMQSLFLANKLTIITTSILLAVGMFSNLYLQNVVRYGTPFPACEKTMSLERCMKSYTIKRSINLEKTKNERPLSPLPVFTLDWIEIMTQSPGSTAATSATGRMVAANPFIAMRNIIFFGSIFVLVIIIYCWRAFSKNKGWYFLIIIASTVFMAVFIDNYLVYLKTHAMVGIQPRYLLGVLPIVIVMAVVSVGFLFKKSRYLKVVTLLIMLLIFTQGGGLITHIVRSNCNWYWDKAIVCEANNRARDLLTPLIK